MCGYFCFGFIDFMLARKTLTEYTNLFSPNNFCNSIKHDFHKIRNIYPNISNEQQFRLKKINEIQDYF